MQLRSALGAMALTALVVGCGQQEPQSSAQLPMPEAPPVPEGPAIGTLEWATEGAWRDERDMARNQWRHPQATLQFCGLSRSASPQSVVEIWPGGGWYTQILAPWLKENDGRYTAVLLDPKASDRSRTLNEAFVRSFEDQSRFGVVHTSILSADSAAIAPPTSADLVLTFRNVHSWLARAMAPKAFADFYAALKPGGALCVIEHRLPDAREQDPQASSGYVQRSLVIAMAIEAGFVFEAQSAINANVKDTADHPFGVWTLPPVRRNALPGEPPNPDFDAAKYEAIGESDRMTLRFRKPDEMPAEKTNEP